MSNKRFLLVLLAIGSIFLIFRFVLFDSDLVERTPIVIISHESGTEFPLSYAQNGIHLEWDELYFADSYYILLIDKDSQEEEMFYTTERNIILAAIPPGEYQITITGLYEDELDSASELFEFTVLERFDKTISRSDMDLVTSLQPFSDGYILSGFLPQPHSQDDWVLLYAENETWKKVSFGELPFIPVHEDGYFEVFTDSYSNFNLSVTSSNDEEYPESISSPDELPSVDGIFILNRFNFSVEVES